MSYSRIVLFPVGLYLLQVALSTIATLIVSADETTISSVPFFVTLYIIGFFFSLFVYIYLAYREAIKPYQQAVYVALIYWLVDLGVGLFFYIFLEIPFEPLLFVFPALLHVIAVILGTLSGINLRHKRELSVTAI